MTALRDLRVLDLSRLLPGGLFTQLFADLGADVLKVEDTGAGDYLRWARPAYQGPDDSARSAAFLWLNRGKRSIRLDLKHEQGRLVLCSISGYEQHSPQRERSGHDLNYLALSGLTALTGAAGGPPVASAGHFADIGVAMLGAFAVLAALRERDSSGHGQHVDVSLFGASVLWLGLLVAKQLCDGEPVRRGVTERAVCYRLYACADGHVSLAALEPKFWQSFCRGVQREDLIPHQWDAEGSEAHTELQRLFVSRTRAQWRAFAHEHDCCLEPVLELDEALASALARERGLVATLAQPGIEQAIRHLAAPFRLSRTPARAQGPASGLGEHTHDVLASLGRTPEEIDVLEQIGAIAGPHHQGVRGSFLG